ncbi:MAG: PqqD family peptide modification chaperone [Peptostreptococcaceae bacterium]
MNNEDVLNIVYKISSDLEYKVNDDNIVTILEKQDHFIQNFFRKLRINIPMYKHIKLDKYGSYVFLQIDGENTIREIGENLENTYGDNTHPLFERLLLFLNYVNVDCNYIEQI